MVQVSWRGAAALASATEEKARAVDVEDGFALTAPLVFHYGHKTPSENLQLYNLLISRMAEVINLRCENNNKGG